jgi:hypothetical protein
MRQTHDMNEKCENRAKTETKPHVISHEVY